MNPLILLTLTVALLSGAAVAAPANPLPTEQTPIGSIGDTVIRLEAIETREIHELRVKLHEAIQQAFSAQAISVLKNNKTGNSGIDENIEITDAQVKAFYLTNGLSKRGTIEELGPQIKSYMVALLQSENDQQLYLTALKKGDIKTGLAEPLVRLIKVPVETAYLYGETDGQVMLLEFSDFQCPFCQRVKPTLRSLLEQYGDKVAFGYRHFPLDFHNDADSSAIASECAREQGKFVEMHDQLYTQQHNQSVAELKAIAQNWGGRHGEI
jgi:thiol-disulfide isomerase/thioredoxin